MGTSAFDIIVDAEGLLPWLVHLSGLVKLHQCTSSCVMPPTVFSPKHIFGLLRKLERVVLDFRVLI